METLEILLDAGWVVVGFSSEINKGSWGQGIIMKRPDALKYDIKVSFSGGNRGDKCEMSIFYADYIDLCFIRKLVYGE